MFVLRPKPEHSRSGPGCSNVGYPHCPLNSSINVDSTYLLVVIYLVDSAIHLFNNWGLGSFSRNSRKLFGPEKPFVKLRLAYSVKLVFPYVKGIKIKITAKFRASRRLRFKDTKRIMSPEMRPRSFGTFEKRALYVQCKRLL